MDSQRRKRAEEWLAVNRDKDMLEISDQILRCEIYGQKDLPDLLTKFCEAELTRMEQALAKYGDHTPSCDRRMCWHGDDEHEDSCCDCGFLEFAALTRAKGEFDGN